MPETNKTDKGRSTSTGNKTNKNQNQGQRSVTPQRSSTGNQGAKQR